MDIKALVKQAREAQPDEASGPARALFEKILEYNELLRVKRYREFVWTLLDEFAWIDDEEFQEISDRLFDRIMAFGLM